MLRPADKIDISEEHLHLIKEVYESQMSGDKVHCVPFFLAIRKNRQLRNMANAIARDPEGLSRIPLETF